MILALTSKNKMSFVDRTLTRPSADDTSHKSWIRRNSMVIGWIISNFVLLLEGVCTIYIQQGKYGSIWKIVLGRDPRVNSIHFKKNGVIFRNYLMCL